MKTIRVVSTALVAVMLASAGATDVRAQADRAQTSMQRTLASMVRFTETLLLRHPYLLTKERKERVGSIHREIRRLQTRRRQMGAEEDPALWDPIDDLTAQVAEIVRERTTAGTAAATSGNVRKRWEPAGQAADAHVLRAITLSPGADHALEGPVALAGDSGALLFEVLNGAGPVRLQAERFDFSESGPEFVAEVAEATRTLLLVSFDRVPRDRTSVRLDLRSAPDRVTSIRFDVTTPGHGRLRLTVLSDDTGGPVPAMVGLRSTRDGRDRAPGGAIDLAPNFDNQGRPTARRGVNSSSVAGGDGYWVVAEPFDMALPPGEWEVTVRRGLEHVPVIETFVVESDRTVTRSYRPRRWVDMRERGWYAGDDHVHFRILSDADARKLMAWVQAEDIRLANVVKMGDIDRTWFEQRGFGKEYRVIDGDTILSPGQECPRTHAFLGHTLAMNITSMVRDTDSYYLYDKTFDAVHRQGGLTGYAHVNSGLFHVHRDMSMNIPKGKVDFVELLQFGQMGTELYYEFLNLGFEVTASAGSDVPWGGTVGEVRVYAYLGDREFGADAWFEAVERGRTFVTNGPMLELEVADGVMPGDEMTVAAGQKLRVRARAWGDPGRSMPRVLELVRHGEVIATAVNEGSVQELEIELEVESEGGFWIAARATGTDDTSAHTTPVYVRQGELRFWKADEVEDLVEKRLSSLAEIEAEVARVTGELDSVKLDLSERRIVELAVQGPQLLERVDDARRIYDGLLREHESEKRDRADG